MPYAANFADQPRVPYRDQVLALFGGPALHSLGDVLPAGRPRAGSGARGDYPALLQFAVAVTARIYGSQRCALSELDSGGLWEEACAFYLEKIDQHVSLPSVPPTAKQQDRFVAQLCKDGRLMGEVADRFTRAAIGLAKHLGNFPDGGIPDYAQPDPRHTVFGDGTYLKPFSDVVEGVDPVTGELIALNSRATAQAPRIQKALTDPKPDQKTARGINHVTLSTWTTAGWVVLANAQALSAEVHAARDVIASVHHHLQERLHTVVWDRVLQGQDLQDLMADKRLMVITKPVARATTSRSSGNYTAPILTEEDARSLAEMGAPLPLGTSVYPRSSNRPAEVTRSRYYPYITITTGTCDHDLWVDDGALVEVEFDERQWRVKTGQATAVTSVPLNGREFTVNTTWQLSCPHAPAGVHEFDTQWQPRPLRPTRGPGRAEYDLRPVARLDRDKFAEIHGLRNITESYNSWFKSRLGANKRAMRLGIDAQFLDHICTGTLANTLTLYRHLRMASALL